jgi:hypothetical protein
MDFRIVRRSFPKLPWNEGKTPEEALVRLGDLTISEPRYSAISATQRAVSM